MRSDVGEAWRGSGLGASSSVQHRQAMAMGPHEHLSGQGNPMGSSRWQRPTGVQLDLAGHVQCAPQVRMESRYPSLPPGGCSIPFLWVPSAPPAQSEAEAEVRPKEHTLSP